MKKILLVVTLLAATFQLTFAQERSISGKITDETGVGMPGANVQVKGTTRGTITNGEGQFTISAADADVITISAIGYISQEITVGTQTSLTTQLVVDIQQLQEVVVVGYGNQERSMVTSAISSVKGESLRDLPVTSFDQKLQGQLAGVQINQSTGAPGGGAVIRIRGAGSLSTQNGANDPLFVIDGFPVTNTFSQSQNPLATINPDDIESITVLKDAASTSIYGSRGANGVIIINTKRAKSGQSSIEVSSYVGTNVLPSNRLLKMMNGQEYAQFVTEIAQDQAAFSGVTFDNRMLHPSYRDPSKVGAGTDWFSMVTNKNAIVTNHNVTITKGTDNVRALVSAGYFNQEGNVKTTGIERYSLRTNIDATIAKKVTIGFGLSPTFTVRKGPAVDGPGFGARSIVGQAYYASPVESPYLGTWDVNGNYTLDPSGVYQNIIRPYTPNYTSGGATGYLSANPSYATNGPGIVNPLAVAERVRYRTYNVRTLANTYVSWQIIPGLTVKSTFNMDMRFDRDDQFNPANTNINYVQATPYPNAFNTGVYNNSFTYNWLNENTIDYSKSWDQHKLSILAGYSVQKERSNAVNINASQYNNDDVWTINNATVVTANTNSGINEWRLISQFARATYSFGDKYVFSGTIRRDGSSRFGSSKRYAAFPSVSGAWIASNESFFPQSNVLTELKVRVSYGLSGSNAIGNYSSYSNISLGSNFYNFNSAVAPAAWVNNIGNPELTWEESRQTDIGLDFQFYKGRINLVTEFYNRLTTNMLQAVNVLWSSGFATANVNRGEIQNRGLEIAISSKNTVNTVKWSTDFNISMNRNKVLDLGGIQSFYGGNGLNSPNLIAVGQPLGMFTANLVDGFLTAAEVANTNTNDPNYVPRVAGQVAGGWKYRDIGTASDVPGSATQPDKLITSTADRVIYATPYPKFVIGLTNRVTYKNFDLSALVQSSYGNKIFAQYKWNTTNLDGSWNVEKEVANRFRQTNPTETANAIYATTIAGSTAVTRDNWFPTTYFYDGSYINVKNVTLGYNVKLKDVSLRVYASGQNLLILTKYPGGNPEVSQNGNSARQPGIDNVGYPLAATYTIGANFKF